MTRPTRMKAGVLLSYDQPVTIMQVPMPPVPTGRQVVLKVDGCGICGSDLHLVSGAQPGLPPAFPHIPGHEIGGYVYEVGDDVTGFAVGDPAVVWAAGGCGRCSFCISGRDIHCREERRWPGTTIDGGYAEYVLIENERFMVKLDGSLPPREAAPFTDAAITGYGSVRKAIPYFDPEFPVLAIGIGAIGTYGLQYLKKMSGCQIIAVDVTPAKLEAALRWGADWGLDGNDPELVTRVMELTNGNGVCAVVDFVGTQASVDTALAVTRAEGIVVQTGMAGGVATIDGTTDPRVWSVKYEFSLGASLKQLREVMALIQTGRVGRIPVEFRPLEEINEVYEDMRANRVQGRIVVIP